MVRKFHTGKKWEIRGISNDFSNFPFLYSRNSELKNHLGGKWVRQRVFSFCNFFVSQIIPPGFLTDKILTSIKRIGLSVSDKQVYSPGKQPPLFFVQFLQKNLSKIHFFKIFLSTKLAKPCAAMDCGFDKLKFRSKKNAVQMRKNHYNGYRKG